uniref:rRNA N-glycosylase n=1 Tax=Oryza glumipatula TaxID=40148 RepID=A0A0E0BMK7_9ORYZ
MRKRHKRMLEICSTTVDGMPVTPPQLPFDPKDRHRTQLYQTYHLVELVHPDDHNYLQLMFRETDMYFVAFRHLTRDADRNDTSGWFRFNEKDEFIVPSFIQSEEIFYDYGYGDLTICSVGPRCFTDIYHCLRRFTPANAKGTSDQRTRVLMTCCLMFSETQRFMQMQEEVLENIRKGQDGKINHLITLIHDWIVESRRRASTADQAEEEVPASAQEASSSTCSTVVPAAAAQEASPSGSVDYGLWLLKYDNGACLPLIQRQQQLKA